MTLGAGKYDDACSDAFNTTQAGGVILIVFDGSLGNGFSAQLTLPDMLRVPSILRQIADQIEQDRDAMD